MAVGWGCASETTDEVWLELDQPSKKPISLVFAWGDQTFNQLALPHDHEYSDFALETTGALSDRAIAARKAQMALEASFEKGWQRRGRPRKSKAKASPFAAFSNMPKPHAGAGAGAGAGAEAGAGAGSSASASGDGPETEESEEAVARRLADIEAKKKAGLLPIPVTEDKRHVLLPQVRSETRRLSPPPTVVGARVLVLSRLTLSVARVSPSGHPRVDGPKRKDGSVWCAPHSCHVWYGYPAVAAYVRAMAHKVPFFFLLCHRRVTVKPRYVEDSKVFAFGNSQYVGFVWSRQRQRAEFKLHLMFFASELIKLHSRVF